MERRASGGEMAANMSASGAKFLRICASSTPPSFTHLEPDFIRCRRVALLGADRLALLQQLARRSSHDQCVLLLPGRVATGSCRRPAICVGWLAPGRLGRAVIVLGGIWRRNPQPSTGTYWSVYCSNPAEYGYQLPISFSNVYLTQHIEAVRISQRCWRWRSAMKSVCSAEAI
jgi:hypothetical protein